MKLSILAFVLVAVTACTSPEPDPNAPSTCPSVTILGQTKTYTDCDVACTDGKAAPDAAQQCTTEEGVLAGVFEYGGVVGACNDPSAAHLTFHECLDTPAPYVAKCDPSDEVKPDAANTHSHVLVPHVTAEDVAAGVAKTYPLKGELHEHTVTITAADFAKLARFEAVDELSTTTDSHNHVVSIHCR